VVEESAGRDGIGVGSRVVVETDSGERTEVTISNAGGQGAVSPESPLGRALYGASQGDKVTVEAPAATWTALVVSVS
jgi:transcription elongation GreA/GreB family factor